MKITRIGPTEKGASQFTELDIPLQSQEVGAISRLISSGFASPNVSFIEMPEGSDSGWHGATGRCIVSVLSGVFEVEIGSGETRQWRAGEAFFIDDIEGTHVTRIVEGPCRAVMVTVPSDFVIDAWK